MTSFISPLALACLLVFNQDITNHNIETKEITAAAFTAGNADTSAWISSFKIFRDAVLKKDKAKVKEFFKFPVMNEANEIWIIVLDDEKKISALPSKIKPFTEKDFDKYYDRLFSGSFIRAVSKIRSDELYKKGKTETVTFKENKNSTYKMYANVDKATRILSLNLAFNTIIRDEEGNVQDVGESNIIYQFKIAGGTAIVFKQIRIAG